MKSSSNVASKLSRISTKGSTGFKEIANMKLGLNSCYVTKAVIETKGADEIPHIKLKFENNKEEFVLDFLRTSNFQRFEQSFHRIKYLFKGTKLEEGFANFDPLSLLVEPTEKQLAQLDEVMKENGCELSDEGDIVALNPKDSIDAEMSEEEIAEVYQTIENDTRKAKRLAYENGFEPLEMEKGIFACVLFPIKNRLAQCEDILEDIQSLIEADHKIVLEIKNDKKGNLNVTKYLESKV